jgi:hypothetical protein
VDETNLNVETSNRVSDVSGLLYGIDIETSNRISGISGAIYIASTDATAKADTAENNAKQYADDLALATQKWLPAVQTIDELPANPGDGTYLCRVITGDAYGVYQWIGTETNPKWSFFSDNLDFIDRIANPVAYDIPVITSNGELIDSGESISGILKTVEDGLDAEAAARDAAIAASVKTTLQEQAASPALPPITEASFADLLQ